MLGTFEAPEEGVPVGDSQSAGDVENAVERITAQLRTLKSALESRIKATVPENHPII